MFANLFILGAIDERMIAAMRLMLALLALLSTYIDPAETTHYVAATYTVLAFYLVYSLTLLTLAVRRRSTIPATVAYWADVGWDILLIGSSMGTNSIFFFGGEKLPEIARGLGKSLREFKRASEETEDDEEAHKKQGQKEAIT